METVAYVAKSGRTRYVVTGFDSRMIRASLNVYVRTENGWVMSNTRTSVRIKDIQANVKNGLWERES